MMTRTALLTAPARASINREWRPWVATATMLDALDGNGSTADGNPDIEALDEVAATIALGYPAAAAHQLMDTAFAADSAWVGGAL
jgi:hypothetical protein